MNHWIFQANPNRFNLDGALIGLSGPIAWEANQFRDAITAGDRVYLWRAAGSDGRVPGIVARGRVGSPSDQNQVVDDSDFVLGDSETSSAPQVAIVELQRLPAGRCVAKRTLRADPRTANLSIIKMANATNFRVTPEEAVAIDEEFDRVLAAHPIPAPLVDPLPLSTTARTQLDVRFEQQIRNAGFWKSVDEVYARREAFRGEELPRLQAFFDGTMSLADYATSFDRATKGNADGFSFGGLNGGMVLNQFAKHTTHEHASPILRDALHLPTGLNEARSAVQAVETLAVNARQERGLSPSVLANGRLVTFLSYFWHLQEPDLWPAWYSSLREASDEWGAPPIRDLGFDAYIDFVARFEGVRRHVGEHLWFVSRLYAHALEVSPPQSAATPPTDEVSHRQAWLLAPGRGGEHWDLFVQAGVGAVGWEEMGDLSQYPDADAFKDALIATYDLNHTPSNNTGTLNDFTYQMKPGDWVFAKVGRRRIIGGGVVTGPYFHEDDAPFYRSRRTVDWLWTEGEYHVEDASLPIKTLTQITNDPELVAKLLAFGDMESSEEPVGAPDDGVEDRYEPFTLEDATRDLFVDPAWFSRVLERLRRKKNIVLQGPPGTGKTLIARRLSYALMGEKAPERRRFVQFHQSMSYEDFVQGLRPDGEGGFHLQSGPFVRLCKDAARDEDNAYVLAIDEINRGNLSRIFGEALVLIEHTKRTADWGIHLTYGSTGDDPVGRFFVPENVHIIGTMNTADRSLAIVDYALRRRFSFIDLPPAFSDARFGDMLAGSVGEATSNAWIARFERVNRLIADDPSLGEGFCIGHSYLCEAPREEDPEAWLAEMLEYEVAPLLSEYWFDNNARRDEALAILRGEDEVALT